MIYYIFNKLSFFFLFIINKAFNANKTWILINKTYKTCFLDFINDQIKLHNLYFISKTFMNCLPFLFWQAWSYLHQPLKLTLTLRLLLYHFDFFIKKLRHIHFFTSYFLWKSCMGIFICLFTRKPKSWCMKRILKVWICFSLCIFLT